MEVLIGFVAGYLVGCQDGKDGVRRLRSTAEAIVTSAEFRRLTTEAVTVAGAVARRAASGRGLASTVTDILAHRESAAVRGSRAA